MEKFLINNKFRVTGFPRSGTTLTSVLLNSQSKACCFDFSIETYNNDNSIEKRNKLCTMIEAHLNQYEIQHENFRKNNTIENIKKQFYETTAKYFNVSNIGTKTTKDKLPNIIYSIENGIKVIIMRRKTEHILASWINKFDVNLYEAAIIYKQYLKDINNFKFDTKYSNKIYILEFENLLNNPVLELNNLSSFLNFELILPKKLYYSFSKNRFTFNNNSSFGDLSKNIDTTPAQRKVSDEIQKIAEWIDNPNMFNVNPQIFKLLLKKKISKLFF